MGPINGTMKPMALPSLQPLTVVVILLQLAASCAVSQAPAATSFRAAGEPIQEQATHVVEWLHDAQQAADKAGAEALLSKEVATKAKGSLAGAIAEAGAAKAAMFKSESAERKISALRDQMWQKAKLAAKAEVRRLLPGLLKEAQKKADADAKKKAKLFEKAMKVKAKVASAKAAKVFTDHMAKAGKTAADYAAVGDDLVSQSANMQMSAGLSQGQANQYIRLGMMSDAQKYLQSSRSDMNVALGLNAQATGMYDTANKIAAQMPAYASQAAVAAYHARSMYDPDALPPPPALVLVQKKPLLSKTKGL